MYRRPDHHRVDAVERFGDPDALWRDLLTRGTRQPAFRVVCAGTTRPKADVTRRAGIGNRDLDDVIAPNQVVDRYRRGDTVVLQGLHHTDPALARLANNLALALDQPVQINAYLSPASSRGLDLHFDYHDVFVVQLAGAKHWRVWAPLDRTGTRSRAVTRSPRRASRSWVQPSSIARCGGGVPVRAAGVPPRRRDRGRGIGPPHHRRHRGDVAARRAPSGRRRGRRRPDGAPLPLGLLEPGAAPPDVAVDPEFVHRWVQPATLKHWLAREIWRRQPATRLRPRLVPEVGPAPLVVTPGPLLWLTTIADRAVLGLGDRVLDLPAEALDCLAAVLGAEGAFDAADSTTGWTRRRAGWCCAASPPKGCSSVPASYRCADAATERAESAFATGSRVSAWILIEVRGAWGPDAVHDSALGAYVPADFKDRLKRHHARAVCVRSDRDDRRAGVRLFVCAATPSRRTADAGMAT